MFKRFSMIMLFVALLGTILAEANRGTDSKPRPRYAPDLVKVKLSAEAITRTSLPSGLYAQSNSFQINELDQILSRTGGTAVIRAHREVNDKAWQAQTGFDRWFLIKLDGSMSVEEAIRSFKANRYIEDAIPEYYAYTTAVPNDTYYANNWGHNNTAQLPAYSGSSHSGAGVGTIGYDADMQLAWDQSQGYGSATTIIAIIDTGVDTSHPDLRLVPGYDYGDNDSNPMDNSADPGHGTSCSGVAAGKANNSLGVSGVAGGCSVMPLKIASSDGSLGFTAITNAITHCGDNNVDVASMSFGAEGGMAEGDSPSTDAALEYAYSHGVTLLAATANSNTSAIAYPSNHNKVISVGASSPTGQRKSDTSSDGEYWWGSNYGIAIQDHRNAVDIMAPTILPATDLVGTAGSNTSSSPTGDYYMWFNGTSCATPYAAGVAALLISKDPTLTPAQVRQALVSTCTDMTFDGGAGWDRYTGYGMVNANAALLTVAPGLPSCTITSPQSGAIYNLSSTVSINVAASDTDGTISNVKFYIDDVLQNTDSSSPYAWDWNTGGYSLGSHSIKAIATDNGNNTATSTIAVTLVPIADEGFESGDFNAYPWVNASTIPWTVQSNEKYSGTYAAKSGTIGDSATTELSLTLSVSSAGNISFYQRVSSETGYDYLRFFIDSVQQGQWSGEGAWTQQSYAVGVGVHTFMWRYVKDNNTIGGSDCAWIDHLILPPQGEIYYPPQSFSAAPGNGVVNLLWQAPLSGTPTGYKIFRNSSLLTTTAGLSYADNTVINGTTYSYYLKAVYAGGESDATTTQTATPSPAIFATIGSGTSSTANTDASPINVDYKSLHGQAVYTAAELNAAGITGPINITQIGFNVTSLPALAMPNFVVRLAHTSASNVSSWITTGLTTVYSSASYQPTATGWNMLTLSTPFAWNGTSNILVDTAFGLIGSSHSSGTVQYTAVTNGYRFVRNDNSDQTSTFTGGSPSSYRPNLRLICTASLAAQSVPFVEGFEQGWSNWTAVNGAQPNIWARGTAIAHTGSNSLYISSDNGTTNSYTNTASSVVHIYRDIALPAGSTAHQLRFAWKGMGESGADLLRVYVIDASTNPVSGTSLSNGQLGSGFGMQSSWQETTLEIPSANNGQTKRLVFSWINNGSGGSQTPIAIDNIRVLAGVENDLAIVIDSGVQFNLPTVTGPASQQINGSLQISGVSGVTSSVQITTGYATLSSPYENAGLNFTLSGAIFSGASLQLTHNLGFVMPNLAYRIGDSGEWILISNPGSWTESSLSFSVGGKGANDLFIVFAESGEDTLPVTLSSFTANLSSDNYISLQWVTASETNLLGFYIYRSDNESLESAALSSPLIAGTNTSNEQCYLYTDYETEPGNSYYYWLQSMDLDGETAWHGPVMATTLSGSYESEVIPKLTKLLGNYPNPFNPSTTIRYSLDKAATVNFCIWNHKGQLVQRFTQVHNQPGYFSYRFDGRDSHGTALASGVYYLRMQVGDKVFNQKLILLK